MFISIVRGDSKASATAFLVISLNVIRHVDVGSTFKMYAKCQEGKVRENEERRAEEMHRARMKRLEQGLDDGVREN